MYRKVGIWLMLLFALSLKANADVIPATFGTPVLLSSQKTPVRLVSEQIHATVFDDYCEAVATYEFFNPGKATTLTVGFPEFGPESDVDSPKPGYARFEANLNSRHLKTRSKLVSPDEESRRRVARVQFASKKTSRIEIRCRTTKFQSYLFSGSFIYVFGEPRWAGNIEKSDFIVEFRVPNTYILNAYEGTSESFEEKDAVSVDVRWLKCSYSRRNWRPHGKYLLDFLPTLENRWLDETGNSRYENTLTVPGKARGISTAAFWLPPALVRDGTTFVRLDTLAGKFRLPEKEVADDYRVPAKSATLRAGGKLAKFTIGSRTAYINGRPLTMPAAPFVEKEWGHDIGEESVFYIPLLLVTRVFGGTSNVDWPAHRFYISMPGKLPPIETVSES